MKYTETAKFKILSLLKDNDLKSCVEYPILNKDGYGIIQGRIENKKAHMLAHRLSYQLYYNDNIECTDIICHKCDNPKCINPLHLYKGTHKTNSDDKVRRGRQPKGKTSGRYIDGRASDRIIHKSRQYGNLTFIQVLEVRKLKERGIKLKEIAEILNIPYHTVRDISCGRVYKDIF